MSGYERDQRFIVGHYQPASLIDLALSRGIDSHRLLRGCEVFYEDISGGSARFSQEQFLTLIDNARRLLDADDSAFLFGQRLLPGHYGEASQTLLHARDLYQALENLCEFHALLSPLLTPRLLLEEHYLHLYWQDGCGAGNQTQFLGEACLSAVLAMSRRLVGEHLPWRIQCAWSQPRHIEQYWVYLGEEVRFDAQITLLSLPREFIHRPLPNAAATPGLVARQACLGQLQALGGWVEFPRLPVRSPARAYPRADQPRPRGGGVRHQPDHAQAQAGQAWHPLPAAAGPGAPACGVVPVPDEGIHQ